MGRKKCKDRKFYSDYEISTLVDKIDGLKSVFDNTEFDSMKKWRLSIYQNLDGDSCKRFFYELERRNGLPKCQLCGCELGIDVFIHYSTLNRGFNKHCSQCTAAGRRINIMSDDVKKKRGEKIRISKLAFYQTDAGKEVAKNIGEFNSLNMKRYHATDEGKASIKRTSEKLSVIMKEKILVGEFTPNSNNKNTHWESSYNNKHYRSSWEALYQYFNPVAEYEMLRIKYVHKGVEKVYIVDFIDNVEKIVCEVKPKRFQHDVVFESKLRSLTRWASENGYSVIIFDEDYILSLNEPTNYDAFDAKTEKKIRKLYATAKNKVNRK